MNKAGYYYGKGLGVAADAEKALDYYRDAKEAGNYVAMNNIGALYQTGSGSLKQDMNKAYEYYDMAQSTGYAFAMKNIGDLYYNGKYPVDQKMTESERYDTARQWYDKAAANGYDEAYTKAVNAGSSWVMRDMGLLYANGNGVEQSYDEAARFYRMAAEEDNAFAMANLGFLYFDGNLSDDKYKNALLWFNRAANAGLYTLKIVNIIGRQHIT